jgi:hypothetical protein
MADGTFPGLVSKDRNVNAVANPIYTQLTDGAIVLSTTLGVLNVNATIVSGGSTQYAVDAVAGAADLGNLALVVRDDALSTLTPADADYTQLRVGSTGALWTTFTNTTIIVTATALDIRTITKATDSIQVSANTAVNSILNPIYVQTVTTTVLGDEIANYSTATPAGDAASNHDYTVAGTTFLLKSVIFSCSGAGKAEIQTGPVASLTTKAVVFLNARQGDTKQVFFDPPIEVPVTSTGTVRVIRTNRNASATDVYSTIIGNDVA